MADKRDYYEVLGINKGSSEQEIKSAYRKKAMQYHPDKNPGDKSAEESFKEVNEAYSILSDAEKKNKYDKFGHAGVDPNAGFGGAGFGGAGGFDDIFDIFGNIFGGGNSRGGYSQQRKNGPSKGRDLQQRLVITFKEAAFGVEKTIKMKKNVECDDCNGTGAENGTAKSKCSACGGTGEVRTVQKTPFGAFQSTAPCRECNGSGEIIEKICKKCNGSGEVKKEVTLKVKIPAGVDVDSVVPIKGQGLPGKKGGPAGDLYIVIDVKNDTVFKRSGPDLYLEMPINFMQATLGDKITIPTVGEKISYKIPSGTQSGTVFRIKDKGLVDPRNGRKGDLYVKVNVEIPTKLSKTQKATVESFEKNMNKDNYPKQDEFSKKIKNEFV